MTEVSIVGLHPKWRMVLGTGTCCKCLGSLGTNPKEDDGELQWLIRHNRQMYFFAVPPAFGHVVCP